MKRILALVVIVCSALLSSCDSVSIGIIGGSDGPTSVIVAENEEQTSNLNDIDKYFKDNYVDKQKLPILDINIENPVVSDDRILVLDDTIENNLELLIYEYYKNLMSGSFEDVKEIIADGSLLASNDAYENNFKEGIYYSKIEIDEIELIDKDDLDEIAIKNKQAIVKKINDLKMTEFAIVEVDKTSFIIKCKQGALKVLEITPFSKKQMKVKDYFNGVKKETLLGKCLNEKEK